MQKLVLSAAVFVCILLLTKIANQVPPEPPPGTAFSLKAQRVIQCNFNEITLVDGRENATRLDKDGTWPDCSAFEKGVMLDFYLSRGDRTRFLSSERTVWWRKAL